MNKFNNEEFESAFEIFGVNIRHIDTSKLIHSKPLVAKTICINIKLYTFSGAVSIYSATQTCIISNIDIPVATLAPGSRLIFH